MEDYNAPLGYNFHMSRFRSAFFFIILLLTSCNPSPTLIALSSESNLFVFDLSRSSLIEYASDFTIQRELPIHLPCPLIGSHPSPNQKKIALELECVNGPLVQIVDINTGAVSTPFTDMDSHFLAWDFEGNLYLRVDALGKARLMRVFARWAMPGNLTCPHKPTTWTSPRMGGTLIYSFTRGLGTGFRTLGVQFERTPHPATLGGRRMPSSPLRAGRRMEGRSRSSGCPTRQTPFPMGELWVMEADGSNARRLAPADAGHGYAAAWSPDSTIHCLRGT